MRLFKSPEEIEILRKGCQITALAHKTAMKEVRPGMNEGEVEALVDYIFRKDGCQRVGYGSIVAGGKNAACLHYRSNNEVLKDGDLLLIDAGGEYGYYSADITRTFPMGRNFLELRQRPMIWCFRPKKKALRWLARALLPEIHKHTCAMMMDGLISLGLVKGTRTSYLEVESSVGSIRITRVTGWEWMFTTGLYVKNHEPRPLEPGMVFTIEPGFYVQPTDRHAPADFRDIGIRIEDDILVTSKGCEVLTRDAPKERAEIEALRG